MNHDFNHLQKEVAQENKRVACQKITEMIMKTVISENSQAMSKIIEKLVWSRVSKMREGCLVENSHAWERYDLAWLAWGSRPVGHHLLGRIIMKAFQAGKIDLDQAVSLMGKTIREKRSFIEHEKIDVDNELDRLLPC